MFSGIVAGTAEVKSIAPQNGGYLLILHLGHLAHDLLSGQSVAVNGVCLTAVEVTDGHVSFNVISETLRKTNLGKLQEGSKVNIERSLRPTDRFEGHIVQGHVQTVVKVVNKISSQDDYKVVFELPKDLAPYCPPLGCIAINGVSLTIASIAKNTFTVALIPTTLELTNLGELQIGGEVNIEPDIMTRQIVHYLEQRKIA